eukprot:2109184-Pleurochrysis_carterae.AAC.3
MSISCYGRCAPTLGLPIYAKFSPSLRTVGMHCGALSGSCPMLNLRTLSCSADSEVHHQSYSTVEGSLNFKNVER